MLRAGLLITANAALVFLIELGWTRLAVRRRWGFVTKPRVITTFAHMGLFLAMIFGTTVFLHRTMPANLVCNLETRKHLFAAAVCAWLIPTLIVAGYYNMKAPTAVIALNT